jgi:hypothetical protein
LALTAGQIPGFALQKILNAQDLGGLLDPLIDVVLGKFANLQSEGHVLVTNH